MRTTYGMLSALALTFAPAGCAQIVGVDDFTVAEDTTTGPSSGAMMEDTCVMVHGCERATADDKTSIALNEVYVAFGPGGYSPRCIRIRSKMKVIFNSSSTFVDYPIAGGTYPKEDPASPIKNPPDPSVTEAPFTLEGDCVFPYFSPPNGATMNGAIFVGGI